MDDREALLAHRLPKGADKYDGKLPLTCFSCNKIGRFASRCLERMSRYDKHERNDRSDTYDRYEKHDKNDKPYKPYQKYRNQKRCYYTIDEGVTNEQSWNRNSEDEFVFIAIKEDDLVSVNPTSYIVEENDLASKIK